MGWAVGQVTSRYRSVVGGAHTHTHTHARAHTHTHTHAPAGARSREAQAGVQRGTLFGHLEVRDRKRRQAALEVVERRLGPGEDLRFRGGLVFKAHRLLYHSTLGSRVMKKKRRREPGGEGWFINSQTRPLHANEENQTTRKGTSA